MEKKKKKTYVVVDEFGNVSPCTDKEEHFGFVASVTDDPESFADVSRRRRAEKSEETGEIVTEVKSQRDTIEAREKVTDEISALDVNTYAYYVEKRDPPDGWDVDEDSDSEMPVKKRRNIIRNSILDFTIFKTVSKLTGDVEFVIDRHNSHKKVHEKCSSKSNDKRQVSGKEYDSELGKSEELFSSMIQTHDYSTNAAGSKLKGYPERANKLKINFLKIGPEYTITEATVKKKRKQPRR